MIKKLFFWVVFAFVNFASFGVNAERQVIFELQRNGDSYTLSAKSTADSPFRLSSITGRGISDFVIRKNGEVFRANDDELMDISVSLFSISVASSSLAYPLIWDNNLKLKTINCSFFNIILDACGVAKLNLLGESQRIEVYKDIFRDAITGASYGRTIETAIYKLKGIETSLMAIPVSILKIDAFRKAIRNKSTIVSALFEIANSDYKLGFLNSIPDAELRHVFSSAFAVIDLSISLGKTGLDIADEIVIHQYVASSARSLEMLDTLEKAYTRVLQAYPEYDPAIQLALTELRAEYYNSDIRFKDIMLESLAGGGVDFAESILKFSQISKVNKALVRNMYSAVTADELKVASKKMSAITGVLEAGIEIFRSVSEAKESWERLVLSSGLVYVADVYRQSLEDHINGFASQDFQAVTLEGHYKIQFEAIKARNALYAHYFSFYFKYLYDSTLYALADDEWSDGLRNLAINVSVRVLTGEVLSPFSWYGDAVDIGQFLASTIQCGWLNNDICLELRGRMLTSRQELENEFLFLSNDVSKKLSMMNKERPNPPRLLSIQ